MMAVVSELGDFEILPEPEPEPKPEPYYQQRDELVKLYQGDCLELMPQVIADKSIDCIICDLPYGVTGYHWDLQLPLDLLWREYKRVLRPHGVIVLFGNQPFTNALINSNQKWFRYELIWEKTTPTGFLDAHNRPLRNHENILVFTEPTGRRKTTYNPQFWQSTPYKKGLGRNSRNSDLYRSKAARTSLKIDCADGKRYPKSVLRFSKHTGLSKYHPNSKPVALLEWLIKTYTNPGDKVLDNTCGGGSTLVAAYKLGRPVIGIELDQKFVEAATARLIELELEIK
jgi:site-specific DNA-methyltransferase (adenine-specific)